MMSTALEIASPLAAMLLVLHRGARVADRRLRPSEEQQDQPVRVGDFDRGVDADLLVG
jgi:hypothetical protein